MNDAECTLHNIQWSSTEIGTDCPACQAENVLAELRVTLYEFERLGHTWSLTKAALLKLIERKNDTQPVTVGEIRQALKGKQG